MSLLFEKRLFNRTFPIDEISKRPQARQIKFKRAFQFLQLLLIQRVYTLTAIACSNSRRLSKHQHNGQGNKQQDDYDVFLGGSCNPTTWRHDQAIPYFSSRSVSYYNPQVANWTPDLVEIEHRAKELAPLLFFVIDHDTRALASMVEVCYLAARGRSIIVVMSPMPEMNSTKFIQQKSDHSFENDRNDFENACETRRVTQQLLRSLHIPVFETIDSALECAAYILETTKRNTIGESRESYQDDESNDVISPLPSSPSDFSGARSSSVVFIRSLSNKKAFDDPDEFYRQMRETNISISSSDSSRTNQKPSLPSISSDYRSDNVTPRKQLSCITHESDDDGYSSLKSSNREFSLSNSSLHSETFEAVAEYNFEQNNQRRSTSRSLRIWLDRFYSYIPFIGSTNTSMTQSIFVLFTKPFRFLRKNHYASSHELCTNQFDEQADVDSSEGDESNPPTSPSILSSYMFDVYLASGNRDQLWLETVAYPMMKEKQVRFIQRKSYCDGDQADVTYDKHLREKSKVLFYLINAEERLSDLTAELAFLIGERKRKIVVYIEPKVNLDSCLDLAPCERRDLDRSRSYLLDLVEKEHIQLGISLEHSLQLVFQTLDETD